MLRRIKQHEAEQEQCISLSLAWQNTACFISMGVGKTSKIFFCIKCYFLNMHMKIHISVCCFDLFTTVKIPLSPRDPSHPVLKLVILFAFRKKGVEFLLI